MTRYEANKLILIKLLELVEKHPDMRFGQMLINYVFPALFYEESTETLKRLEKHETHS